MQVDWLVVLMLKGWFVVIIFSLISVTIAVYDSYKPWNVINFHAVVHFEGIETFYLNVNSAQRTNSPPRESKRLAKKIYIKQSICKNILRSYFFKMAYPEVMSIDVENEEIRAELLDHNVEVFNSIYKSRETETDSINYEYLNPYVSRDVHVGGEERRERTFTCPVRDYRSRKIKEYFISGQYNVNLIPYGYYIAGRFIFSRSGDESNEVHLVALAEEAAIRADSDRQLEFVEPYYLRSREQDWPSAESRLDPICSLSESYKLRLCTTLFGSEIFKKKKTKYLPIIDSVDVDCVRKQLILTVPQSLNLISNSLARKNRTRNRVYEEWMMGCKAVTKAGCLRTYWVSRGDINNSVFVFKKRSTAENGVVMYNYFQNLSVVGTINNPLPVEHNVVD